MFLFFAGVVLFCELLKRFSSFAYALSCTRAAAVAFGGPQSAVDLYNSTTGAWSTAQLSMARCSLAAASVGGVAIFAGGWVGWYHTNVVDLYNSTTGMWSTAQLSMARSNFAAASVGTVAMFAGGDNTTGHVNTVDVFNSVTETWSTDQLSVSRNYPAATSVGGVAIFAGGFMVVLKRIVPTASISSTFRNNFGPRRNSARREVSL